MSREDTCIKALREDLNRCINDDNMDWSKHEYEAMLELTEELYKIAKNNAEEAWQYRELSK